MFLQIHRLLVNLIRLLEAILLNLLFGDRLLVRELLVVDLGLRVCNDGMHQIRLLLSAHGLDLHVSNRVFPERLLLAQARPLVSVVYGLLRFCLLLHVLIDIGRAVIGITPAYVRIALGRLLVVVVTLDHRHADREDD